MDGCCAKVLDELNLAQRVACGGWNCEHPHLLSTVLETKSASEHSVA